MAGVSDPRPDSTQELNEDEELILKVRTRLNQLSNQLRLAHEQGNIIEQRLVRYETLYERTDREALRWGNYDMTTFSKKAYLTHAKFV